MITLFEAIIAHIWSCMQILNVPNVCSAAQDLLYLLSASCELLLVSYGLKTASKMLRVLGCRLLELLFTNSGPGTYSRATLRLLNACVACGCELTSNQEWVNRSSTIVFSIYLALKLDQFSPTKTLIAYLFSLLSVAESACFQRWV